MWFNHQLVTILRAYLVGMVVPLFPDVAPKASQGGQRRSPIAGGSGERRGEKPSFEWPSLFFFLKLLFGWGKGGGEILN